MPEGEGGIYKNKSQICFISQTRNSIVRLCVRNYFIAQVSYKHLEFHQAGYRDNQAFASELND